MSYENDESWFDVFKDINLWHDASKTLENYDKWIEPPNTDDVVGVNNESPILEYKQQHY